MWVNSHASAIPASGGKGREGGSQVREHVNAQQRLSLSRDARRFRRVTRTSDAACD